jgi:pyruvate/oxaloacetate carboxyltransferase
LILTLHQKKKMTFLQDIYKLDNQEFIGLMTNVINNNVSSQQMDMLKGMFSQMRSDKSADAADDALNEIKRIQKTSWFIIMNSLDIQKWRNKYIYQINESEGW